jgi:smad nuclear-interacting protein 1
MSDEEKDEWKKQVKNSYSAPYKFLEEAAMMQENEEKEDVFKKHQYKTIKDNEDSYHSKWRNRQLSVESKDVFSNDDKNKSRGKSYQESLKEIQIENEKEKLLKEIKEKEKELERQERLKRKAEEKETGNIKKSRWDISTKEKEEQINEIKNLKEEADFKPSGNLYKEMNQIEGKKLKWLEPPECRKPKRKWLLYVIKEGEEIEPYKIYKHSSYLIGKDADICDILLLNQSCSSQHAVICFRETEKNNKKVIKPFIMDLKSTNSTFLNDSKIEDCKYYELKEFDEISFASSKRKYVLIPEDIQ